MASWLHVCSGLVLEEITSQGSHPKRENNMGRTPIKLDDRNIWLELCWTIAFKIETRSFLTTQLTTVWDDINFSHIHTNTFSFSKKYDHCTQKHFSTVSGIIFVHIDTPKNTLSRDHSHTLGRCKQKADCPLCSWLLSYRKYIRIKNSYAF